MIYVLWISFLFFILRLGKTKSVLLILPVFYCAVCIYSYYGIHVFKFAGESPYSSHSIVYEDIINTVFYFLATSWSFYIGIISWRGSVDKNISPLMYLRSKVMQVPRWVVYILYFILIVNFFIAWGSDHIFSRIGYVLSDEISIYPKVIFTFLLPVVSFFLGSIYKSYAKYILFIVLILLIQSLNSRLLIIIPVFFCLGECVKDGSIISFKTFVFLLVFVFCSALVLEYREYQFQGLIPNINRLFTDGVRLEYFLKGINYITSYSFFANLYAINDLSLEFKSIYLSINPLPGAFIDTSYLVDNLKLNVYAPYPALSMLALAGNYVVIVYYYLTGFFWAIMYSYSSRHSLIGLTVVAVLFLLFTIFGIQYSLRSITRFFYYALFISILIMCLRIFIRTFIKKRSAKI